MAYRILLLVISLFCICFNVAAVERDPGDFAVECNEPTVVGTAHNNPEVALGEPSSDTLYYGSLRPVVPLYPASGSHEVFSVLYGGPLVLKFNHPVADDENNPYGIDFIVFGNSWQMIGFTQEWHYGDPWLAVVSTDIIFNEPGKVSVSQDGQTWYSYDWPYDPENPFGPDSPLDPNVPVADDFAPTLGRVFDEADPYDGYSEGWDNKWWGEKTDPTLPLDPNITPADFVGKSLAEICQMYGKSAGGTGFDLRDLAPDDYEALRIDPQTGRRWIQYVKIECIDPDSINTPDIDAVSDVSACGDYKHPYPAGDINQDCSVNLADFAILSSNWLECTWMCD